MKKIIAIIITILGFLAITIDIAMIINNDRRYFFLILLVLTIPGYLMAVKYLFNLKKQIK